MSIDLSQFSVMPKGVPGLHGVINPPRISFSAASAMASLNQSATTALGDPEAVIVLLNDDTTELLVVATTAQDQRGRYINYSNRSKSTGRKTGASISLTNVWKRMIAAGMPAEVRVSFETVPTEVELESGDMRKALLFDLRQPLTHWGTDSTMPATLGNGGE